MTYLARERRLRWAYAGDPPALRIADGRELVAPSQGVPLGVRHDPEYDEGMLGPDGSPASCSRPTG